MSMPYEPDNDPHLLPDYPLSIPPSPEPDGWIIITFNALPGKENMYLFKEMLGWKYRAEGTDPDGLGLGMYPPGLIITFTPEAARVRRCTRLTIPWNSIMSMQVRSNSDDVLEARRQWKKEYGDK